jgi:hypothetical protein
MGFLMSIRKSLGLPKDDSGFSSALWNIGQIERYGAIMQERPFEIVDEAATEDREGFERPERPTRLPLD